MSDIKLILQNYVGDEQDDDDYNKYYEASILDQTNPDDLLTPLEKLHKYCSNENIFTRQMVARSVVETVHAISTQQDCLSLLEIIVKLSNDIEPSVRCELIDQLPPCCMLMSDLKLVQDAIPAHILPVMVKYLTDTNNQVRKLSQNALLQLMDQDLIHQSDIEVQICPVILTLTEAESGDDFRTEAVTLMTKVAPLVGGDTTEKLFIKRFGDLCSDPLFHVRKVCASNFGDMAYVIKAETTEQQLLPLFSKLCEDGVWGVRKACAETFTAVSSTCSRQVKYDILSPLFVQLLCDKSRWVQMAAYQSLGQFIATFADPERTGFDVDDDGQLYQCHILDEECQIPTIQIDDRMPEIAPVCTVGETTTNENTTEPPENQTPPQDTPTTSQQDPVPTQDTIPTNQEAAPTSSPKEEPGFWNFEFWRTPLPDITLDLIESSTESSAPKTPESVKTYVIIDSSKDQQKENKEEEEEHEAENKIHAFWATLDSDSEDEQIFGQNKEVKKETPLLNMEHIRKQNVIPHALLEHFVSMTNESKAQTIDGDLSTHCAFSLPAVTLALGRQHWQCVKDIHVLLSSDMQWKVRRTLAFSLHDLALILGQDISVKDLVPVFNGFLKDLDEVRVGVLKHLYNFIQVLPTEIQKEYLSVFGEFLNTDNTRYWRFRLDLSQQLMCLIALYNEGELAEYICPVALNLASDKVAEVRESASQLLCMLIKRLSVVDETEDLKKFTANIKELGDKSQHWVKRKSCCQIYLNFLQDECYDSTSFSKDFLPSILELCKDSVPNIRVVASKTLTVYKDTDYFQSLPEDDEVRKSVDHALELLQEDIDRDVRYFSGGALSQTPVAVNQTVVLDQTDDSLTDGTTDLEDVYAEPESHETTVCEGKESEEDFVVNTQNEETNQPTTEVEESDNCQKETEELSNS